jgi:hypothetical protein
MLTIYDRFRVQNENPSRFIISQFYQMPKYIYRNIFMRGEPPPLRRNFLNRRIRLKT